MCLGVFGVIIALIFFFRAQIASAYLSAEGGHGGDHSADVEEVKALVVQTIPFLCLHMIFDFYQAVGAGIIRGVGLQTKGSIIVLSGWYLLAIPIGASLALATPLGLVGTWIGSGVGCAFLCAGFATLLCRSSWDTKI